MSLRARMLTTAGALLLMALVTARLSIPSSGAASGRSQTSPQQPAP